MYSTNTQPNLYPDHHSQFIPPQEQNQPSYPPPPSFSPFSNSNVFSDLGSTFSAVGAAYGFNPDQPIHPSSQYQQQHQHQQLHQQQFPVPMPNPPYQTPGPDWYTGHSLKRQRFGDNLEEEEPQNKATKRRPQGACTHCKALKVKCEFTQDPAICNRCRSSHKQCIVMGRKPRRPLPKREDLLKQIQEQESLISDLHARLEKSSVSKSGIVSQENVSSPQEIRNQAEETNQHIPEDLQLWIQEAKVRAHSGGVEDLEPTVVNAVEASDDEGSEDEVRDHRVEGPPAGIVENGSSALSPSAATDSGYSSTTKGPVVGGTLHPMGLIASDAVHVGAKNASNEQQGVGIAHPEYFKPGMSTDHARLSLRWAVRERQPLPKFFSQGLVTAREGDKLFEIYFNQMNLSVSLLDPKIYTAPVTYWRSPFLFTVICAIASRYLVERPDLYPVLMNYAKVEAGQALVSGLKSPELVAGYILLSLYPVPSTTWEEDRGWLMLGVAIRMATDLNLHHSLTVKATTEQKRREVANRTRIWINCYNLHRSTSTQFGKPSTIKDDYIATHSKFWYKTTDFHYDIHLNSYTQLLRVMARFHAAINSDPNQPTGLNKHCAFEAVTEKYEQELYDHWAEWEPLLARESDKNSLHCQYRIELLRLANAYSLLVILSFRFQNAFQNGLSMGDPLLQRCIDTASSVVQVVVDNMAPHPFLRTSPDALFVTASFASVFLLKLLRPRFSWVLKLHQKEEIINLVKRLIDVLQSEVAIDERHTPKLYAKFLTKLLDKQVSSHRSTRSSAQPSVSSQPSPQWVETSQTAPAGSMVNKTEPESFMQYPGPGVMSLELPTAPLANEILNLGQNNEFSGDSTMRVPMSVRSGDILMDLSGGSLRSGSNTLASMRAVENPGFWDHALLPGFSWPPLEVAPEFYQTYQLAA